MCLRQRGDGRLAGRVGVAFVASAEGFSQALSLPDLKRSRKTSRRCEKGKMSRRPSLQFARGSWNRFSQCCSSSRAADWAQCGLGATVMEVVRGHGNVNRGSSRFCLIDRRLGSRDGRGSLSPQAARSSALANESLLKSPPAPFPSCSQPQTTAARRPPHPPTPSLPRDDWRQSRNCERKEKWRRPSRLQIREARL